MPKRKYELPSFQELNKKQDAVLRLSKNGAHLVIGGPGTGKTVIALLRVLNIIESSKSGDHVIFLAYNKVLKDSIEEMLSLTRFNVTCKITISTSHSWLAKTYYYLCESMSANMRPKNQYNNPCFVPTKTEIDPPTSSAENFNYDYEKIKFVFNQYYSEKENTYIIVDEAQDMPVDFYEGLLILGYQNIFLVADQNQTITNQNSTIKELRSVLNKDPGDIIRLDENYRNSKPIAILSSQFYTDKTSPKPKIPNRHSLDTPQLINYHNIKQCYSLILRAYDNEPRALIGLIVPTENKRDWYTKNLQSYDIPRDNEKPFVRSYSNTHHQDPEMRFSESGIIVLTDKSVKGLEFDIVFIILEDFKIINGDDISMKKRFYVMTSRATDKLFFLKHKDTHSAVIDLLPNNETILQRRELNNV